jgi:hypothetical protein
MKYLCLLYYSVPRFDTLTGPEREAIGQQCQPHDEALRKSGQLFAVASLAHRTTVTLCPQKGKASTSDAPLSDAAQQIGAFLIVEARDLNDAIRVASLHPAANTGEDLGWAIEVRPIRSYEQPAA